MAHFSVWQRSPLRNSFIPSRRHCRQTGPMYRAKSNLPFQEPAALKASDPVGAVYGNFAFVLLYFFLLHRGSGVPGLHENQTRRFLGGRHRLCGSGVRSRIERTSKRAVDSARPADSRPAPGPLTFTSTLRNPDSLALL